MPAPPYATSVKEIFATVGLGALGFILGAAAIHVMIPEPLDLHADLRSEKLALAQRWHGQALSAAFGSSHVHDGFDPSVLNRALAGTPYATSFLNLAVEGGSQSEQRVMALRFIRQLVPPKADAAPGQPCILILELAAGANIGEGFLMHPRAINLYDWPTTRFVSRYAGPETSLRQRLGRIGFAWAELALHESNVGMLSSFLFPPALNQDESLQQAGAGPLGQHRLEVPQHRSRFEQIPAEASSSGPVHAVTISPGAYSLVRELAEASPVNNLSFVYLVMPDFSDFQSEPEYPDHMTVDRTEVPILNLAQPDRYPQLFQAALWHDDAHLAGPGAALASTLLAEQLEQWYAAHGGPAPCGGAVALR